MSSGVAVPAARSGIETARGATAGERIIRPEFTGSAGEYFRIWIVNLFFTLITLGIYSAWAKVRKKRYFYGSTRLDGDSFDYFASPKTILKGRIVAFLVFVTYALAAELYPSSALAFWAAFLLILPWLVMRALTFNARNSAYRGLRFDFAATPREAVRVYIGMPLVVALTLGLALPWFIARQKAFVLAHHALGTTRFGCDVSAREFFGIYILASIILLGLLVPAMGLMGFAVASQALPEAISWAGWVVPVVLIYAAYAVVYAFIQARTTNLLWNGAHGPGIRFSSTLAAAKLARLYIGNVIAIAVTAGLLIPWAVVRTLRYRLDNMAMHVRDEAPHEANPALERVGATGQELGDIFNLDLGI
ncbi:MAG TPA: YjgN family protein [Burkholderiales bacterium]|nr:YjgN family protein [Burkholderiales bacterium]